MPAPTITGTVSGQTTTSETPIDPFSGVTIGDANAGATDTLSIALSGPGSLSGTGLSVSNGTYMLTGTAAAITSELRALSFTSVDGVPNASVTTTFTLSDTSSAYGAYTYGGQPSTLATFTGANGAKPLADVVSDAAGDLFGVTSAGGANNDGTVFEIVKSSGALITLATFTGANGAEPWGVTVDAAGDLFGTTSYGGANGDGTVFEIAKSTGQLTTLATFTGANGANPLFGSVVSDAAGDLFGTTAYAGPGGYGTVFEIAKSTGALTTLAAFSGANGATPAGNLTIDAEGDLFGTTANGGPDGANGDGTVFKIAKSTGLLTTLATFTGSNGQYPERGLTIDAAGDLFGTTFHGGADNDGTVFEIVKSTGALITLATFTGANGAAPLSQLVSDAAGDLFGTTENGGADNDGTAFEIAKSTGLLSTLASFTGANGQTLNGGLTFNSAGDLFGTTYWGGANSDGTVFELPATFGAAPTVDNTTTVTVTDRDSDPVVAPTITGAVASQATTLETPIDPFSGVTIGDTNAGATDTLSITLSGPGSLSGTGLSGSGGSYTLTGTAAAITSKLRALSFTPVDGVPNTSVTTTFTLSDTSSAWLATVNKTTVVTDSDPVVTPTITGAVASQATTLETPIDPFSGVTIGDTNAGATDTLSITLSGPG
ncbi:MAG TPA: choice-of-anchor tandem repeat GloVer-containing protein, partial [Roseiarcus sp.]